MYKTLSAYVFYNTMLCRMVNSDGSTLVELSWQVTSALEVLDSEVLQSFND
jgi:hypothetical protein